MKKFKGAWFVLSDGKQVYVRNGPRVSRKLKKKIKEGRILNFAVLLKSMFNIEVTKLPEQEVKI